MADRQQLPPGIVPSEPARTFKECVAKINASDAFFAALAEAPDPGPIINLNFLRYRPRGDASRYNLYGAAAGKAINSVGGNIVFHAGTLDGGAASAGWSDAWDGVALPVYPRRASYNELQQHESYQLAIPDRVAGTFERLLYVLSDGDTVFDGTVSIAHLHDSGDSVAVQAGDVFVAELLRFAGPDGLAAYGKYADAIRPLIEAAGGTPALSVVAEMPIVSEQFWDHFTLVGYPSADALESMMDADEWRTTQALRTEAVEASIAFPLTPEVLPT